MAQNGSHDFSNKPSSTTHDPERDEILTPPAVTALKADTGAGPGQSRHAMERSFSQDIQEGSRDLKEAAEQTRNIILDLSLDGIIRWVSPSWTDVVGTNLESVKGNPISRFIADDQDALTNATASLKSDDSKSKFVKFSIKLGPQSDLDRMLEADQRAKLDNPESEGGAEKQTLVLEGQGIIVYDRASGGESHTMWMLQPAAEPLQITIALPQSLVESLGVGAEVLAKYLTELAENGANDPGHHPPPLPILCRVCERSIVPWWFEKHSDLCVQEHKAELDVQMAQESLAEHRHAIVKVLDYFEARQSRGASGDNSPALGPVPEYKGLPIGPTSTPSSGLSSGPTSHPATPNRSRSPAAGLGHARARSFAVRRPLARIVELILDLCDTALEINVPAIKDTKTDAEDEFRTQSPQSDSRISQVMHWQQPTSLDQEPGLASLSLDTETMAKAKVEAVRRHRVILEYSERIRQEYIAEVDACIAEALEKAERAAAGEPLSSSESDVEPGQVVPEDEGDEEEPTPLAGPVSTEMQSHVGMKSMASAIRYPSEIPPINMLEQRRPSSTAISSRSSSPMECPTPRSHRSTLLSQPQPNPKRSSIYQEGDANDSDSSIPSVMSAPWRTDSPASDIGTTRLGRTASSRDRKRRSLHIHGLSSGSPRRQQSPGRYPQPPPSPLRMSKPRFPSGESMPSPIVSPLLTTGEFMAPAGSSQHHRRQSSAHTSDSRAPGSPHLSSINHSQQRVVSPSIKDFEIIKPISKGAFGSVYLAKKKLTGEYFAIKVLRKADMVAKNQVTNVKAERAIMMWQGESDFVAKLYWTFSSKEYLYLVMEYLNGGDCASLIKVLGGLTEDWAKKYIAEVVLGVEHLHSRGIVHRDLKPDNLLIDAKGHLKLTDFGLSRMGLVGRQKRVLKTDQTAPDLLKQGPFARDASTTSSRSASFDFLGNNSPNQTPLMTPAFNSGLDQPSYFSLNRESSLSRQPSRKGSGHRSDFGSISSHDLHTAFRSFSVQDHEQPAPAPHLSACIEDEGGSQGSASPDLFPLSQSLSNITQPLPPPASQMLPPAMALFDPDDTSRRFVGTPDYLAPETISGAGQDEMSDWWSMGCMLFEFLYGFPPFNAKSTDEVFENILHRRIAWPEDSDNPVSEEAKDLINKLIQIDPRQRLGANTDDKFPNGGAEIKAHPWFSDLNWDTFMEDEAQFIPNPENPEDTEYFDTRGATLQSFPEELEDQASPVGRTPGGTEIPKRPHDALLHVRNQVNSMKRGLMPLHIPPHVVRDSRSRRLSEPVVADDFGNFTFKNLPVLEKANKDIVNKMREEAIQAQAKGTSSQSQPVSASNTPTTSSPAPSLESSPMLSMPLKRAISVNRNHTRPAPSAANNSTPSPVRPSQPSSPLMVQFSTRQNHERRKTSSSSQSSGTLQPANFFEQPRETTGLNSPAASSPIKNIRMPVVSPAKFPEPPPRQSSSSRSRSQTLGSQEGDLPREGYVPGHYKRRSQLFAHDVSPSSSDTENNPQAKALLKVQRRRQSSRRFSQINMMDGPFYRPLDILICEDHPVSKMVMERLFEKLRCRTITASSGSEAMRMAVSQIQFDIIFMEYKLPMINGIDVARMVRDTNNANTRTPIIAVTGYLKELPETHHFDTLIAKPPTLTKLTEALCKYCSWKPPPKDFKLAGPLNIPHSYNRVGAQNNMDSPSSVGSSVAPTMPDSSYKSSSRENSIGSSFFGDVESLKSDDLPVIVSRQATGDWSGNGGLGISEELVTERKPYLTSGFPHLIHTESAPANTLTTQALGPGGRTPRRQTSKDEIKAKRESIEKKRADQGSAESGDDEDEELGDVHVRARSPLPKGQTIRQGSRLGHEMMRTNSRGSVISNAEESGTAEPDALRKSLEIVEQRMEGLQIPEEPDTPALAAQQPRKLERAVSSHSHPDSTATMDCGPLSLGHITPPEIFPLKPGHDSKIIDMKPDDDDATPMPTKVVDFADEPTPRPHGSPSEQP